MTALSTHVSARERRRYHSTARAVLRLLPEPESWLDVGTGDAHFPGTARELFPYTSFDGLDPTPRVSYACHAERVEEAFVGHVTDPHITTILRARYDVVTLLQDRSPVPDLRAELRAAVTLVRRGGLLLVEAPATRSNALRAQLDSWNCPVVAMSRHLLGEFPYTHRLVVRRIGRTAR